MSQYWYCTVGTGTVRRVAVQACPFFLLKMRCGGPKLPGECPGTVLRGTGHLSSEPVRNVVGMYFLPAFRQAWCFCQNHTKSVKFISVDCQHFCVNSTNFSGLKKSRPSPYGISGLKKSHYGIYGWREVHKTFYGQVYGKANVLRGVCRILVSLWSKKVKQTLNSTRLWNFN